MMKQTLLFLALALTATVNAGCPNSCSGHGTCGANDLCTCHRNWSNSDCSGRKCPMKKSWADTADTTVAGREAHYYEECSGKGICNSETGTCECYEGFSGKGCERLGCPDDCNNHGTCELLSSVNSYTGWDANKIQTCSCDAGYEGNACQNRMCPRGDDPMTLYSATNTLEVDAAQTLTLTTAASGSFALTYTDVYGQAYSTHSMDVATSTGYTIQQALEALPNQVIPSITVTPLAGLLTAGVKTITFTDPANSGPQNLLTVLGGANGACADGCQPVYISVDSGSIASASTVTGTKESAVCSNRGLCDSEIGRCTCHEGFTGEACETQTIIT